MKKIVQQDLKRIYDGLTEAERAKFQDSTVLFTGGAGFFGVLLHPILDPLPAGAGDQKGYLLG